MSDYPEHEKIKALDGLNDRIGEFLDWLRAERGIVLAEYGRHDQLWASTVRTEDLLAEFFNVDLKELEEEKRRMLDEIREEQLASQLEHGHPHMP